VRFVRARKSPAEAGANKGSRAGGSTTLPTSNSSRNMSGRWPQRKTPAEAGPSGSCCLQSLAGGRPAVPIMPGASKCSARPHPSRSRAGGCACKACRPERGKSPSSLPLRRMPRADSAEPASALFSPRRRAPAFPSPVRSLSRFVGRAFAPGTYLGDRRAGMMRLAPVLGLAPRLELHRLNVRPGDDEVGP
jgi:hypothetical protein